MHRFFSIVGYTPLFFMLIIGSMWLNQIQYEKRDFNTYVLEKQLNHASDAAVDAMLQSDDLSMDSRNDSVAVNPDIAAREFASIMCSNKQMPVTDDTIRMVQNSQIKALIVCAYDGMYAYCVRDVGGGDFQFISSPKIPYFYTETTVPQSKFETDFSDLQTQYVLNLGLEKGYKDSYDQSSGTYKLEDYKELNLTDDVQLTAINNDVSALLHKTIEEVSPKGSAKYYNLPSMLSEISGTQPIKSISVIGIMESDTAAMTTPALSMGVGGSRIVANDPVIGFVCNGTKYYAKQSRLDRLTEPYSVKKTFASVYDAAAEGYHCMIPLLY